ncbi:hypothetical protein [Flavobacterium sp.]|uniref:hypothetical protein n=1 Tax=Flavobacterium sp. TaxID=239 RepID=UPI0031E04FFD
MQKNNKILGLKVHAIIHYYSEKKISISFDNTNSRLEFYDCPIIFDSGIIGKKIQIAEEYKGEMSFVIVFREMKLDVDDYNYFIIKGEEGKEHYQNQIRIAYKRMEIVNK